MNTQTAFSGHWSAVSEVNVDNAHGMILDAFAAFAPEAINLETLRSETGLSGAVIADKLMDLARRKQLVVTVEYVTVADDGTFSRQVHLPAPIDGVTCYSITMYRCTAVRTART